MDEHRDLFRFFYPSVLSGYRDESERYRLREDSVEGVVETYGESDEATENPWRVRFGRRRLQDGTHTVAAFAPDVKRLPPEVLRRWEGFEIPDPVFAEEDLWWEAWRTRVLYGALDPRDRPRRELAHELVRIRGLTKVRLEKSLFKRPAEEALEVMPAAENSEALRNAALELYRVVLDGLDADALEALREKLNLDVHLEENKTLNFLKALLPTEYHDVVHRPLVELRSLRARKHGIPSEGVSVPADALDEFRALLGRIASGMRQLREWLEEQLEADADACIARLTGLASLPDIRGSAADYLVGKDIRRRVVGKRITRIELGDIDDETFQSLGDDGAIVRWRSQAAILHFDDDSKLVVHIGSNLRNLLSPSVSLESEGLSTTLLTSYVPHPAEPKDSDEEPSDENE